MKRREPFDRNRFLRGEVRRVYRRRGRFHEADAAYAKMCSLWSREECGEAIALTFAEYKEFGPLRQLRPCDVPIHVVDDWLAARKAAYNRRRRQMIKERERRAVALFAAYSDLSTREEIVFEAVKVLSFEGRRSVEVNAVADLVRDTRAFRGLTTASVVVIVRRLLDQLIALGCVAETRKRRSRGKPRRMVRMLRDGPNVVKISAYRRPAA